MLQILSNSSSPCIEVDFQKVTLSLIQSLPPELKDAALLKFCSIVESKPTLVQSFTLNQVLYRTISGNTFTESAESVAERTGCDRKTILKGLKVAVEQNILSEHKRLGTSTEYSFKSVEEWLPEPVVPKKDTRTKKVIEFPKIQNTEKVENEQQLASNDDVVLSTDDHETDTNSVVVINNLLKEEQQEEVSIPTTDTLLNPSPWKYVGQGIGRVYIPPELDADTGNKIESIHSETKEPRQIIIKRAVDLLHNHLNRIPNYLDEKSKVLPTRVGANISLPKVEELVSTTTQGIPEDVYISLQAAGIDLGLATAERLWLKYSDRFCDAIAYTKSQDEVGKIKQSKEGFFRKSLEEGWNFTNSPKQSQERKQSSTHSLTEEQQQWYEWACSTGLCDGRPASTLALAWNGEPGVFVYMPTPNPAVHPWVVRPISIAMREFPMK